jgi:hypothetical protein
LSEPLASISRGTTILRLYARFGFASKAPSRRQFRHLDDAESFLRKWKGQSGAIADFRSALGRHDRTAPLFRLSDDEIIHALASALVAGSVVATETRIPLAAAALFGTTPPAADVAADLPAALAPATQAPTLDAPELQAPLLPLLEDVQIAGAQVMPEVWQTLEQINLTMEQLNLATVSLEPTPSGVTAITAAMTAASGSITATLDSL